MRSYPLTNASEAAVQPQNMNSVFSGHAFMSDAIPSCAQDCIWYESGSDQECLNRTSFVCHKHKEDIFGNK